MQKHIKFKKQYEEDQKTIKSFDKLHRKNLQDNLTEKSEYESPCTVFTEFLYETKNEFFINMKENQN